MLGFQVARSLYGRWRRLGGAARDQLEPLANDVKERALDLRGETDRDQAGEDLRDASERLATAMVESAESDPEVSPEEVAELRSELERELDRLESADIAATRAGGDRLEKPAT